MFVTKDIINDVFKMETDITYNIRDKNRVIYHFVASPDCSYSY